MNRVRILSAVLTCALLGMAAGAYAQTELSNPQAQRIQELESTLQGVLLPLEGALDPVMPAQAETPPPEPVDDTMIMDGEAPAGVDDATGDAPSLADVATVGEEALPEPEAPPDEPVQSSEGGTLPELDAIDGLVVAELGNPESIGPYRLWLASYGTIREAQAGWQQLAKDNRDVLGDLLPVIVMKELGGESGTFFRLQAGPLAEETLAEDRCETLKSRSLYCAILGPNDG